MCLNTAELMADSADPDKMPHSAASGLSRNSLHRPVCPNTYITVYSDFCFEFQIQST